MLKKVRHIGIVVDDLNNAVDSLTKTLGLNFTEFIEKKDVGVNIAFASIGEIFVELLHYDETNQYKSSIVRKQKGAINHICFEVDDLEEAIGYFRKRGLQVAEGYPKVGGHGKVCFFEPSTTEGILIEICQV
jgi:methylmalonyl-CoA/ethylmalonyl-CoA epimerase